MWLPSPRREHATQPASEGMRGFIRASYDGFFSRIVTSTTNAPAISVACAATFCALSMMAFALQAFPNATWAPFHPFALRCTSPRRPQCAPQVVHMRVSRHNFDPSVYLVTDRRTVPGMSVQQIVAKVVATPTDPHRVTFVQLRDKNVPREDSIQLGKQLRDITMRANVAFVVNDDIQLAALLRADGVHLGQDDQPVSVARQMLGDDAIVGVSAATEQEIDAAIADGADYIGVGSVFATPSKPDAGKPLGEDELRRLVRYTNSRIPLVAIGGINVDNAGSCKRAGADGVAVISAIMASPRATSVAQHLAVIMARRDVPWM